jgi:hypothetical protein
MIGIKNTEFYAVFLKGYGGKKIYRVCSKVMGGKKFFQCPVTSQDSLPTNLPMVSHRKLLSATENVGKTSADYNFSITNLFVYETPAGYENAIKLKKECYLEIP